MMMSNPSLMGGGGLAVRKRPWYESMDPQPTGLPVQPTPVNPMEQAGVIPGEPMPRQMGLTTMLQAIREKRRRRMNPTGPMMPQGPATVNPYGTAS